MVWPAVGCFAASRLVVFLVLYAAPVIKPGYVRTSFFTDWDGAHYLSIATSGYPALYPPGGGFNATAAFFPLLPLLTRGVSDATGLSLGTSGVVVANAAALAALCVIWLLGRDMLSAKAATFAVALIAFWPASFTLSMIYSDSLLLVFAAGSLWALWRERWLAASGFAFLAALARPNALVLALCGIWAAAQAYRKRRSWLPWVGVLGAPAGFVAFMGYLWIREGTPTAWFTAEHRGWNNGFDFGRRWLANALIAIHHPTARIDLVAGTAAGLIGIVLVVWMLVIRAPAVLTIYAAGVVVLALTQGGTGASVPRYCLDAFPIFFAPAIRFRAAVNTLLVGLFGGGLAIFMLVVELTRTTVP